MNFFLSATLSATCFVISTAPALYGDTYQGFEFTDHGETITIDKFNYYESPEVVIPATINGKPVTDLGSRSFFYAQLTSVSIPDTVTRIGASAFYGCYQLRAISIPKGVTSIEPRTFSSCYALESISLPDGITTIGASAFELCRSLKSFQIPPKVTTLSDAMLYACRSLSNLTIPPQVTRIERHALAQTAIETITIPPSVTFVGERQFYNCTNLRHVEFQNQMAELGESMFDSCTNLTEVVVQKGLRKIGTAAFRDTGIFAAPLNGVVEIGPQAFQGCRNLTSVRFSKSAVQIGDEAFIQCGKLSGASFQGDAPVMGQGVFRYASPDFRVFVGEKSHGFTIPRWLGYKLSKARAEIVVRDSAGMLVQTGLEPASKLGIVPVGERSAVKSFVITNVGNLPLRGIEAGLPGNTNFRIARNPARTLAPGASTTIKVYFRPLAVRKHFDRLIIQSSDADEMLFSIPLSGIGIRNL